MQDLAEFWRKNFFSNHYLDKDEPYAGAVEFVHRLIKDGHQTLYLTGRHKKAMWEGTLETMKKLGFPISEDILILKPQVEQKDEIYKSEAVAKHKQRPASSIWLIDNEPLILHQMMEDHPEVELIFFKSCHSQKKPEPEHLLTIDHF